MKTILNYILHVLKLIFTLGIPAYQEVKKMETEREALIVGINRIIQEAKTVKEIHETSGSIAALIAFADSERIKRSLANVQIAYGAYDKIKQVLLDLFKKGTINKVE